MVEKVISRMVTDVLSMIHLITVIISGMVLFAFFGIDATSDNVQTALLLYLVFAHHSSRIEGKS